MNIATKQTIRLEAEAVVVGTGPGGASVGCELKRTGEKVIFLKKGPEPRRLGDYISLLKVDDVRAATLNLLKTMEGVPNFCVSSGCDLPVGTPMENLKAMIETVKEYRAA